MNILIVHAHENPQSFSSALAKEAKDFFTASGHEVTISDLYAKGFNPVAGRHDFKKMSEATYYKYAMEQIHANKNDLFAADVQAEMELVAAADFLIFNFPLWWFDLPAILKGWVDRIFSYGFAYGGEFGIYGKGRFAGKTAMLCLTTGSPADFYTLDGMHHRTLPDILRNINEGVLGLVGYEVLDPFVAYSVSRLEENQRKQLLLDYRKRLEQVQLNLKT